MTTETTEIFNPLGNVIGAGVISGETDDDDDGRQCDIRPLDPDNDADNDGTCGDVDNCPDISNPDQADQNNNGIGDACEQIIDVPALSGFGGFVMALGFLKAAVWAIHRRRMRGEH